MPRFSHDAPVYRKGCVNKLAKRKKEFLFGTAAWAVAGMICLSPIANGAENSPGISSSQYERELQAEAESMASGSPPPENVHHPVIASPPVQTEQKKKEVIQESKPSPLPVRSSSSPEKNLVVKNTGRQWLNLSYGMKSGKQTLDLYLPKEGKGPFPVIVAFHGRGSDKRNLEMEVPLMGLNRGFAVACVNYREAPESPIPADVVDAKAAVRYLKGNASKYHLDSAHIFAWGASFGGKLASFLGTSANHPELEDLSIGSRGQSSHVTAVVALFPELDDLRMDADFRKLGIRPEFSRNEDKYGMEMYGAPLQKIPGLVSLYDPSRYVSPNSSPFFILHGTADNVCPILQSERLANALKHTIGSKYIEYHPVKGAGHRIKDVLDQDNTNRVFKYLEKLIKKTEKKK